MNGMQQLQRIRRIWDRVNRHRRRHDQAAVSLDVIAHTWIERYAHLWRRHQSRIA